MKDKRLFGIGCLLAAASLGVASVAAAEKFDSDPKHQLPKPDKNPADMKKPVKVFILQGQSNVVGMGDVGPEIRIPSPGQHTLAVRMVDPGVVLDKLVLDFTPPKESR